MKAKRLALACSAMLAAVGWNPTALAQAPDHPVITEVFQDALGNDGPVGRLATNRHQEFIEIYVPPAAALGVGLLPYKDALNLTFYEIEGDDSSSGLGHPNYRIDLPTLDLDPSNGLTPGAVERPSSGVIVIGWVDYSGGDPPTGLFGTPSTRVALINGGIVSTTDFTFVAINGAQFDGTTNFPVPVAVSALDPTFPARAATGLSYASTGEIEQGSAAYLLVNRDDAGYAEICAINDPGLCDSAAQLPSGTRLGTSSLLDAFATNDDNGFDPIEQPTSAGQGIDLDSVLPLGGAFSLLVPQVAEDLHGHARLFLDLVKTTEDGIAGNEDPATDSFVYRTISNAGAVEPTPGVVHFTTSPAELQLGAPSAQVFEVLTKTRARPAITAANVGGNFGLAVTTTPGLPSEPLLTLAGAASSFSPTGQVPIFPSIVVQAFAAALAGHTESVSVQVDASPSGLGDPAVVNASDSVIATFTAIDPTTGLDAAGQPFQATTLLAVQGVPDQLGVANEFLATSLGQYVAANLGTSVLDDEGKGAILVNPATDLADPLVIEPLVSSLPDNPIDFIEFAGPPGKKSLVETVLASAEVLSGKTSYDNSFNASRTLLQAKRFTIPDTPTFGSSFVPAEEVHYVNAAGRPGAPDSGLTNVTTGRGFELAILDTNLGPLGFVESGATDDFGVILEVGQTELGSPVSPGEFVFLSFLGGLEGADVDTLDVPPHGSLLTIIYLDLDPLKTVLGVDTVTNLFIVDGSGNGELDPIEVFSLLPVPELPGDANGDGTADGADYTLWADAFGSTVLPHTGGDLNGDGVVDGADYTIWADHFGQTLTSTTPGGAAVAGGGSGSGASAIVEPPEPSPRDLEVRSVAGTAQGSEVSAVDPAFPIVEGTEGDDEIFIYQSGSNVVIESLNRTFQTVVVPATFQRLTLLTLGGNDDIRIALQLGRTDQTLTILAGPGDDRVSFAHVASTSLPASELRGATRAPPRGLAYDIAEAETILGAGTEAVGSLPLWENQTGRR